MAAPTPSIQGQSRLVQGTAPQKSFDANPSTYIRATQSSIAPAPRNINSQAPMNSANTHVHLSQAHATYGSTPIVNPSNAPIDRKVNMYDLQAHLERLYADGDHEGYKQAQLNMNPYSFQRMSKVDAVKRTILNDVVVLTLLQQFLPPRPLTDRDMSRAFKRTHDFLKNNGPNSEFLLSRLNQIHQQGPKAQKILIALQQSEPLSIAKSLNAPTIKKFNIPTRLLISDPKKLTYDLTGLNHTLLNLNGRWVELFKTFDLDNGHDFQVIGKDLAQHLFDNKQAHYIDDDSAIVSSRLGRGSFGTVIPAHDILTGDVIAVKKMKSIKHYMSNVQQYNNLNQLIPDQFKNEFILAKGSLLSSAKKEIFDSNTATMITPEKGYIGFDLALEPEEFYPLQENQDLKADGHTEQYEDNAFEQMNLFTNKILLLESLKLTHPDFKPENIFGKRIGDCGDIIKTGTDLAADVTHSPTYAMPNLREDDLTQAEKESVNRFSLGVTLFFQITGDHPTQEDFDPLLHLPPNLAERARLHFPEGTDYALEGYKTHTLDQVPAKLYKDSTEELTPFEVATLKLAKKLMAEDRSLALADKVDLKAELAHIGTLRQSQQKAISSSTSPTSSADNLNTQVQALNVNEA